MPTQVIKKLKQVRRGEEIGCVVLELGYFIDYGQKPIQDPLSVALSLTDEEKQDERVMISINEMYGGICVVKGLDTFRNHFAGYEEQYVLIGGAACDIVFESNDASFRATRDLDMVLIVEALTPEFGEEALGVY